MIVTYKDDVSTLDPAIGYDWQNWSMIKSLFDGLMDYEPGTTELDARPRRELRRSRADGQTFTFKLRHGVKFHNGREMTADDVKYSLDRVVNPEDAEPGRRLLRLDRGLSTTLPAGKADEPGRRHRRRSPTRSSSSCPGPTPPSCMSWRSTSPMSCRRRRSRSTAPISASIRSAPAPSSSTEWTLGQRLVFERNPDYWKQGRAVSRQDHLRGRPGADRGAAAPAEGRGRHPRRRHSAGQVPGGDGRSRPARTVIVDGGQLHTGYVTMNVNDAAVRQREGAPGGQHGDQQGPHRPAHQQPRGAGQPAAAAVDAGLRQGLSRAMPTIPKAPRSCSPRPAIADGFETELYAMNTDPNPRIAQAIQQDLAAIGIKAEIQSLAQANVIAAGGDKAGAPMIWSGGMAWIADFPDPSNFYGPILGCGGAVQGGWNWSWYCNEDLDAQGGRGRRHGRSGQGRRARRRRGATIFVEIMEDAPWAPVFNEQRFTMQSPRMGGDDKLYRRSGPHPDQLRLRLRQRCAVTATTPSTAGTIISAGTTASSRPSGSRPARRSSSSASMPRAASSRPTARVADVADARLRARSTRSPGRSSSTAPSRATR